MPSSESGLTLIEMIIALAVGALIVGFLAEGTGLIRHFAFLRQTISAQDEILAVRDHLRGQVESSTRPQGTPGQSALAGLGNTVVFTAPGDPLLEEGGPLRITLTVADEGGRMTLSETRSPDQKRGKTVRLVTGAERIAFSYYGAMAAGTEAAWTSEWTDPEISPTLMRIDLAFPQGDRRRWPPFIVFVPSGGGATQSAPAAAGAGSSPPTR